MLAGVLESETGAGDEVLDRLGNPDLRRARRRSDSCADRNRDPGALSVDDLAFPGVHARTDLDPKLADPLSDVERAPDRASGAVERRVEAVARRIVPTPRQRPSAPRTIA